MFRKLSLALAVSAALSSAGALALGLGEIVTKSALNENFNADIALVDVNPADIDGVKVTLASSDAYARAGLDRSFFLSRLRFEPLVLDNGDTVVRITTNDPVREPFLNFLLEVNWPKGRLIREYTVLLDPPVTLARRPPPIVPAETAPLVQIPRGSQGRVIPSVVPPSALTYSGQTLTVPRGATLWSIARELDYPGVSKVQVVRELYQGNPHAFGGGDIDNLLAGAILRLPSRKAVSPSASEQAQTDVRAARGAAPAAAAESSRLVIATPPPEAKAAADQSPPGRGADIERVKTDLLMVRETSESTRQETDELRGRIRELEAQLTDIRRLLRLKSDELALLQAGRGEAQGPAEAEEMPATPASGTDLRPAEIEMHPAEGVIASETPATEVSEAVEALVPEAAGPGVLAPEVVEPLALAPEDTEPSASEPEATEPLPSESEAAGPPVSKPEAAAPPSSMPEVHIPQADAPEAPSTSARVPSPPPTPERGLMDEIMGRVTSGDTTLIGIGGAVAVVLLSLIWLLIRRRRSAEEEFQESALIAAGEGSSTVELEQDSKLAPRSEQSEETSFISDFSPSDIDALQEETGEVDPAAEADVYIAYGRYQQAESLIQQALEKAPDRLDLKLKLLEIYFTTRNMAAFIGLAEELDAAGAGRQDPALWERVQSMGKELAPEHELFGGSDTARTTAAAQPQRDSEALSLDSEALASVDLSLDRDTEPSGLAGRPAGGSSELMGLEDGSELAMPAAPERSGAASNSGDKEDQESEFSLDLGDLSSLEDIDLDDLTSADSQTLAGLDLEELGEAEEEVMPLELEQEEIRPELALEDEEEIPAISLEELDLGDTGMIDQGDSSEEIETKLDLARAYLEMGDGDGAREILDEVLKDGDEAQQSSARELLDRIA
jgi:pilus assembly protein FimV